MTFLLGQQLQSNVFWCQFYGLGLCKAVSEEKNNIKLKPKIIMQITCTDGTDGGEWFAVTISKDSSRKTKTLLFGSNVETFQTDRKNTANDNELFLWKKSI